MAGAAAGAEQAGLFGIGQAHQRTRRQRQQLAAVGLAQQLGGDGQLAAAELQRLADLQVQRHQRTMVEVDLARGRGAAVARAAGGIAQFQLAAQRIVRIDGLHVEQLGLLMGERHAGKAGGAGELQAVASGAVGERVRQELRRGHADVAADQLGGAGQHAALDPRRQRGDHAQRQHRQHQRGGQRAQFRQVPLAAQAAQGQANQVHRFAPPPAQQGEAGRG